MILLINTTYVYFAKLDVF